MVAARIADNLDLRVVNALIGFERLERGRAHSLRGRLKASGPHVAIYKSGRVVVSGRASLSDATELLGEIRIQVAIAQSVFPDLAVLRVENIVADIDLGHPLDLSQLFVVLDEFVPEYEPEVFPGLILRLPPKSATALIFSTGRIVVTGVKSTEELDVVEAEIRRLVP